MDNFKEKTVFITGAASGVGKCIAAKLGREGSKLLITDIEQVALDKTVSELKAENIDVEGRKLDVTSRDDVFAMADYAFEKFGEIDVVFNNAGVGAGAGATNWEVPEKAFRWGMEVNFYGPLYGIQAFVPRMLKQDKECIISATTSGAGLIFPPMAPAYCCSKSALITLYETLSHQLQMMSSEVRAALLFPGPHVVNTGLMSSQRNLPERFEDPAIREGTAGIRDVASLQETMKAFIGRELEVTEPEDFADYVHDALLEGKFWVHPTTEKTEKALRTRFEEMLSETGPTTPDMM